MKPSEKSPGIDDFLKQITGRDRKHTIKNDICATCGGEASGFRNEISRREYTISGMCQKCQDEFFGTD